MATVTACSTLGYAAFHLPFALERIAARGFRKVEIAEMGSYCRHLPYRQVDVSQVKDMLASSGLTPVALNVSCPRMIDHNRRATPDTESNYEHDVAQYARWYFEAALSLETSIVTFPIGLRVTDADWPAKARRAIRLYRRLADLAQDFGVSIHLEVPHLYQLTNTVEHVRAIFADLDHPSVGATVDASHWGILKYDLDEFFAFLGPRLRHAHLRDSAGADTNDFKQNLELTPGRGTVDFAAFAAALDRVNYRGDVSLESEYRHTDAASIESEYDFAIQSLRRAKWQVDCRAPS